MSEIQRYSMNILTNGPKASEYGHWVEYADHLAEVQRIKDMLTDPATVHTNILRGTIALTKAQAIHIAGLPADIEAEVQRLQEQVRLLRDSALNAADALARAYAGMIQDADVQNLVGIRAALAQMAPGEATT